MTMYVLVLLVTLGEPHAYRFHVISHHDSYAECVRALDQYEYKHPGEKLGCGRIE